jgi:tetratricopeptide (TPR) repeat protein
MPEGGRAKSADFEGFRLMETCKTIEERYGIDRFERDFAPARASRGRQDDANSLHSYMEVAMPSSASCASRYTKTILLLAANAVIASSLLIGATGCADALTYAKDANRDGMALYNEGNYTEATAAFANATRQDPRDYKSYYYMGASCEAEHQYQRAISAYRSCLDVMPLTLEGKNNVLFRYRAIDSLATAISKSESQHVETVALEQKCAGKASVEDQWMLAKVYRYTGDADAAIEAYNKAVRIDPEHFAIAKEAGLYEQGLGQTQAATYALKKAYAINPNDQQVSDALRRLGVVVGPSIKDERNLAQPAIPRGPLPEWDASRSNSTPAESPTVQTPRD